MYFAFISSPFPSHLGQMSLAIQELLRRGHRVEIWGGESLRQVATRLGAYFELLPLEDNWYSRARGSNNSPLDYYTHVAFPLVKQQIPRVLDLCADRRPDLLHSNSRVYTAALASRLTGIPCSNHCCSGLSFGLIPEDMFGCCLTDDEPQRKRDLLLARNIAFHEEVDSLFQKIVSESLGIEPINNVLGLCSDNCVLTLSCPELSNARLAALPQTLFTGPLISHDKQGRTAQSDYCYVSLGTWPLDAEATLTLYRELIAAVPEPYRVVVGLGGRFDPSELGIDDKRVTALRYAPQEQLIRGAAAVLCHGGCQTVNEALYFSKPLLMLPPLIAEPREISHKVVATQAGIMLDYRGCPPNSIAAAIHKLLRESKYRRAAERLSQTLRAAGGLMKAVSTLESFATTNAPPSRNESSYAPQER